MATGSGFHPNMDRLRLLVLRHSVSDAMSSGSIEAVNGAGKMSPQFTELYHVAARRRPSKMDGT